MEEAGGALFYIGPLAVTGRVTTMWAIILVLAVVSAIATHNMKEVPGKMQNVAEMVVSKLQSYYCGSLGEDLTRKYFDIFATFFIFIIVSNYSGLLPGMGHVSGMSVPTAGLGVTAGLALTGFFTNHTIGAKERGLGKYLLGLLTSMTVPLFFLAIIEQVVRPFSLALRLYGNLYGEEMVTDNLYVVFPILMPLIMQVLSLLFCLIQAMVFTMLLSIYVKESVEG